MKLELKFRRELNVQVAMPANYKNLIEELRSLSRQTFSHGLPVLPVQQNRPNQWFDIVLRTNTSAITMKIRCDNLYLDGFQMQNSDWLEFKIKPPGEQLISGSKPLDFDGSYTELKTASGISMEKIVLGQQTLIEAVNYLSNHVIASDTNKRRAKYLTVLILMFCESMRYTHISDHLVDKFKTDSQLSARMLELLHGWGELSTALLRRDADPTNGFQISQNSSDKMKIVTYLDAVDVLGILLRSFIGRTPLIGVSDMAIVNDEQYPQGRPLVEVIWVRIDSINGEHPSALYGTIKVNNGLDSQELYNIPRDKYVQIVPPDFALLTGPGQAISAYGSFTINVALMDNEGLSPEQISWNVFNITNVYDKPLYEVVRGKYGSVSVNYAVLSDAVEAKLEVTLINGDGKNPADIYGELTARIGNFEEGSVVFKKTSEEHIDVSPGQLIPLLRSIVAVPLNSSLIVQADLWGRDTISHGNQQIAKGTAEFPAQLSDTSEKRIYGQFGEIRVKVTWT